MTHPLRARAWTPALMLHLTKPCAKRKVLSLTKPKGKIYKTNPSAIILQYHLANKLLSRVKSPEMKLEDFYYLVLCGLPSLIWNTKDVLSWNIEGRIAMKMKTVIPIFSMIKIIIIIVISWEFFRPSLADGFTWSLNPRKSTPVSRTFHFAQSAGGCRMHRLHLCRGVRPPVQRVSWYGTKQSVPVMLELCGMWNTISLPSFPGLVRAGVVAPDRVQSMGQIELNCVGWDGTVFAFKLRTYAKLNCLK